jgi:hypothetical protein
MGEITTSEATRLYRTNPVVLLRLITMGKLQARKHPDGSGRWLINRESLEQWNSRRARKESVPQFAAAASPET